MSCTELYAVAKGESQVLEVEEFRNSWGGGWFVWASLCKKYDIKNDKYPEFLPGLEEFEKLWALAKPENSENCPLTNWEYNVLVSTFDDVMVKRDDMLLLAKSMERFKDAHHNGKVVCSLGEQAAKIKELHAGEYEYVAWNQTSVNADAWRYYSDDDYCIYDMEKCDEHWIAELKPF
jgi:hypothetical protein